MNAKRLLVFIVGVETVLAGIWWYLMRFGAANPDRITAEFYPRVGQTMGMAMGALLGVGLVLLFFAVRQGRR